MLVRRTTPLPIECVARGYISGSGWKDYKATGEVCGIPLPTGLRESDRLPEPIFTPATKAESGHDVNISEAEAAAVVGAELLARLQDADAGALRARRRARGVAGIILADTKFEFGLTDGGELLLIDEMMTPDSSRYWPKDTYAPGGPQPSFDKQYVRDYLESIHWNKQPPVPSLPADVVARTRAKVPRCLSPPHRPRAGQAWPRACRLLEQLVARDGREGHPLRGCPARIRKPFHHPRWCGKRDGNLSQGRRHARRAPQHPHPQDQGPQDHGLARPQAAPAMRGRAGRPAGDPTPGIGP